MGAVLHATIENRGRRIGARQQTPKDGDGSPVAHALLRCLEVRSGCHCLAAIIENVVKQLQIFNSKVIPLLLAEALGKYSLVACLIAEVVLTMMFLFIIMGSTHDRAPAGFAPIAIGLALTLIHLISIPVTNTSVNPARSTGPALFVGDWALAQL